MRSTLVHRSAAFLVLLSPLVGHGLATANAADHFIARSTSSVDCRTGGIKAGDTITLAGGTRGPLEIRNCSGTAQAPIVIRNDSSADAPAVIRRSSASSSGFVFVLENVEHFVLDGTGGWRGSAGHCGWLNGDLGKNCGIQITRTVSGDTPTAFLKFNGIFKNYTIRGMRIDGRSWGSDDLGDGGAGIGIHQNSPEKSSEYPGHWRENIIYEQNYIHNTRTECMYIGPNWNIEAPEIPLRNITIQDSYMHDCGRNAITIKSAVDGHNVVQRNYALRTGLQGRDSGRGGIFGFTSSHLAFRQNIVIESGGQCYGINADRIPRTYTGGYFYAENNLGVRCGMISHPELGYGISARDPDESHRIENVTIDHNTIVDSEAHGIEITISSNTSRINLRNNIVTTPKTGQAINAPGTQENNRTGSVASMKFREPAADDYQLTQDSPARDSGTRTFPATDLLGTLRIQGIASDQGAFEFRPQLDDLPVSPMDLNVQ